MLLGHDAIKEQFFFKFWQAWRDGEPIDADALKVGPHSVDVTLGDKFLIVQTAAGYDAIDIYNPDSMETRPYPVKWGEPLKLYPGRFLLGYVRERFECSRPVCGFGMAKHFTQMYDGRSTVGRLGVISHCTAGYGDFGFAGNFTLEIANLGNVPVLLYPGMRIGQISFVAVGGMGDGNEYSGAYNQQFDEPRKPELGPHRF